MSILEDIGKRVSAISGFDVAGAVADSGSGGIQLVMPPPTVLRIFEICGTAPGESENPVWSEAAVNDGSWQPPAGDQQWWWTKAKEVTYWSNDSQPGWKADPDSTAYEVIWAVTSLDAPSMAVGDWVWCILEPWSGRWVVIAASGDSLRPFELKTDKVRGSPAYAYPLKADGTADTDATPFPVKDQLGGKQWSALGRDTISGGGAQGLARLNAAGDYEIVQMNGRAMWGLAQASTVISAGQPISLQSVSLLQPAGGQLGASPPTTAANIFGQEFAYGDVVLILYDEVEAAWGGFKPGTGSAKILFGKVYTTFTNAWAATNLTVSVKSCAYDGSGVTGDPFNIYTPLIPSKFTRIAVNDIVGYVVDATGKGIIVTDVWADIMWGSVQSPGPDNALGTTSIAVSVKTCLYDGTGGTGDAFDIYTPLNPHRLTNIHYYDTVGFVVDADGNGIIVTDIWIETVPGELKTDLAPGGNATAYQMKSDGSDADTTAATVTVYDATGGNRGVGRDNMTTPPGSRLTMRYNSQTAHWEIISLHQQAKLLGGTLSADMEESDSNKNIDGPTILDGGVLDTSTTITGYNTTSFAGREDDPCVAFWNEATDHWEFLRAGVPGQLRWFKGVLPGALAATNASIAGVTLHAIDGGPDPSGTVTVYNPKTTKGFAGPSGGVCRVFYSTENSHYEFIDVECV
jgi:hypothetical protein